MILPTISLFKLCPLHMSFGWIDGCFSDRKEAIDSWKRALCIWAYVSSYAIGGLFMFVKVLSNGVYQSVERPCYSAGPTPVQRLHAQIRLQLVWTDIALYCKHAPSATVVMQKLRRSPAGSTRVSKCVTGACLTQIATH